MVFERYVNQNVRVFLKNGIKYEGILLEYKDNFLVLDDKKIGEIIVNQSNISDFKKL